VIEKRGQVKSRGELKREEQVATGMVPQREASYRLHSVVPFKFGAIKQKETEEEEDRKTCGWCWR